MIASNPPSPPVGHAAAGDALSERQVGHLRHIENLLRRPPGDWAHMGTRRHWQEELGSYRSA